MPQDDKLTMLRQAPHNGGFRMGLEKSGHKMFPHASTSCGIPIVKGKWQHGLKTKEHIAMVERHYGDSFDNLGHDAIWRDLLFDFNHNFSALDLEGNAEHVLQMGVLEAMGQATDDIEKALDPMSNYSFVYTNQSKENEMKAKAYEYYDNAIIALTKLKKNNKYMIAISKYVLPATVGISEDANRSYTKLREFLEGETKRGRADNCQKFLHAMQMDKAKLYCIIDFRQAYKRNIIRKNTNGLYFNPISGVEYGKTEDTSIAYLLNPKNSDELGAGKNSDTNFSIRHQLNNK